MKGILKSFLLPQDLYADDVAEIAPDCIRQYGEEEWRSVILTNEIHGHLGIYSTLGAKMGLRARDLFREQGLDEPVSVLSWAGSTPPVSCLNDGLQVSTGASMGHGLFAVAPEGKEPSVKARFTAGPLSLEICLKPEYEELIKADIEKGVALYGHSSRYWEYVRGLALRYWRDMDRTQVFTFVFLP